MATVFGRVEQLAPAELRRVTDVTYHGYVWGTQAALRAMRPRNRGTIVQVGSALAHRAIPLQSAYCAAKHAVRAFTDSLRSELLHDRSHVHLTMVQLPAVNTPQFHWCENKLGIEPRPIAPIYQPELVAESIFYAAPHRWREVIVGGSACARSSDEADSGLLDRYLAGRLPRPVIGVPVQAPTSQPVRARAGDHAPRLPRAPRVHDPIFGWREARLHRDASARRRTRGQHHRRCRSRHTPAVLLGLHRPTHLVIDAVAPRGQRGARGPPMSPGSS
jgi:hypothetical protein